MQSKGLMIRASIYQRIYKIWHLKKGENGTRKALPNAAIYNNYKLMKKKLHPVVNK